MKFHTKHTIPNDKNINTNTPKKVKCMSIVAIIFHKYNNKFLISNIYA